jgi:endonuclease-3
MPRESKSNRKKRTDTIVALLKAAHPEARSRLDHACGDAIFSLVATILSAQCTDDRVNLVCASLFKKYTCVDDFAAASQEELQQDIRSTGFYRNKAKNIRGAAQRILDVYGGMVPDTMDALLTLPGVARKTANCVLGNVYGKLEGVVVDTHVIRLSNRMKLSGESDPKKIERDLMSLVEREDWALFSHLIIFHGRSFCTARKTHCDTCPIAPHCPTGKKATPRAHRPT